ncbi:uncharacterized protein AAGF69_015427 [Amazona ochrocephala]
MICNPELRDKPLDVHQKYIVITCNYEDRKLGVKKLMSVKDAKGKCPQLVLVNGEDLTLYREMSYKVTGRRVSREEAGTGHLTQTDQRGIPYHNTSCPGWKNWGQENGRVQFMARSSGDGSLPVILRGFVRSRGLQLAPRDSRGEPLIS